MMKRAFSRVPGTRLASKRTLLLGTGMQSIEPPELVPHRYWQFLNTQDVFFQIRLWPLWAQRLILLPHKSDSQMYNLFFFLNANGLLPGLCKSWIIAFDYDWREKRLVDGVYTPKEIIDMNKVMVKAYNGTLLQGNKRVFDITLGRPVNM
nr:MAG: hypothetical protein [Arizlama virus]